MSSFSDQQLNFHKHDASSDHGRHRRPFLLCPASNLQRIFVKKRFFLLGQMQFVG